MKRYTRLLILLALSLLTMLGLLRLGKIDISAETLARVDWRWFLLGFIIFYLSILARGLRRRRILQAMGWPVSFTYAQALLTAGLFMSSILPGRVGDIGRVMMLKQDYRMPITQGIASIAAERALDVFSVLTLAIIGTVWALQGRVPPTVLQLMVGTAVLFALGLMGLLAVPTTEKWLRELKWVQVAAPPRLWSLYQKTLDFGFNLIRSVRALGRKPAGLLIVIGESFSLWLCDALIIYVLLLSLGVTSPFEVSLFSSMIGVLATLVPITPGALGQFEVAVISMLSLFGIALHEASLITLLARFISLWTFLPVSGLITYIFGFSRALQLNGQEVEPASTPTPTPVEG